MGHIFSHARVPFSSLKYTRSWSSEKSPSRNGMMTTNRGVTHFTKMAIFYSITAHSWKHICCSVWNKILHLLHSILLCIGHIYCEFFLSWKKINHCIVCHHLLSWPKEFVWTKEFALCRNIPSHGVLIHPVDFFGFDFLSSVLQVLHFASL